MGSIQPGDVIFIGLAERAAKVMDIGGLPKWNIIGLKPSLISLIYPLPLAGFSLGFAFSEKCFKNEFYIKLTNKNKEPIVKIQIISAENSTIQRNLINSSETPIAFTSTYALEFFPIPEETIVPISDTYELWYSNNETEFMLGELPFYQANTTPMSEDRKSAILSDPKAMKICRIKLGCTKCDAKLLAYAALDRNPQLEADGCIWYQDIESKFVCSCSATTIDLSSIRSNLHALLGGPIGDISNAQLIPLYEKSALEDIYKKFQLLLDEEPIEEKLQKFIESNLIILHQFRATRLFKKPPILSKFNADFGILSSSQQLILIEIEKPSTALIKRDGGVAAELTHAIDQVQDWLYTLNDHKNAVLSCLDLDPKEVAQIRGVVIAGRDHPNNKDHLRKLKSIDRGQIDFYTYDDLLASLGTLIARLNIT